VLPPGNVAWQKGNLAVKSTHLGGGDEGVEVP